MVLSPDAGLPITLWVVPVGAVGGVGRHVLDVADVGIPGHRLAVICPPGPLAQRLRAEGAAVLTGPVGPEHGIRESVAAVRHAVRSLRPRVTHSHLSWADVVTAAATIGSPTAVVSTEHGIADDDLVYHGSPWRSRVKAAAHTARLRRADAVIAVSEATERSIRAKWHPPRRTPLRLVRNGVDPHPHALRTAGLHVCSIARLAPEKRIDALLRAFAVVLAEHPDARLTIAGDGPEAAHLGELSASLGVAGATRFVGHVDPATVLSEADVLVQLSVWENCSYSLLDALAHGLGAVATPVGGNPEILPRESLVAHDDPAAVARAVVGQGLAPATRPTLSTDWPDRAQMTAGIAAVYADLPTASGGTS